MEAARVARRRLGEILVARGLISEQDVARALAVQASTGKRLGEVLVELGLISFSELADAFVEQQGGDVAKEAGLYSGLWAAVRQGDSGGGGAASTEGAQQPASGLNSPGLPVVASDSTSARGLLERTDPKQGEAADEIVEYEQELEELKLELQVGGPALADVGANEETTTIDLEHGKSDVKRSQSELSERTARIAELEAQVALLQDQHPHRAEEVAEFQARAEQAEHELAVVRAELETRDASLAEHRPASEADRGHSHASAEQADTELTAARTAITELEQRAGQQANRARELEARATALDDQLTVAVAAHAAEAQAHAETKERLTQAQVELHTNHAKLQETEAELEAARARARESLENAQAELADMRTGKDEPAPEMQGQLEEAVALLLFARSQCELMGARLAETERQLATEKPNTAACEPDRDRLRRLVPDRELLRRRAQGETLRRLASDYGVAHTTLGRWFRRPEVARQLKQASRQARAQPPAAAAERTAG